MHYLSERCLESNPLSCPLSKARESISRRRGGHRAWWTSSKPRREKEMEKDGWTSGEGEAERGSCAGRIMVLPSSTTWLDLTSISMTMKYQNVPAVGISMKYLRWHSLVASRMKMSRKSGYPALDATVPRKRVENGAANRPWRP